MDSKIQMAFAALGKTIEQYIPNFDEKETGGKGYISWGDDNSFPEYLNGLYTDVTTLRAIINGTKDFILGDGVSCLKEGFGKYVNKKEDTIEDLVELVAIDYLLYGNAFVQVIRNKAGEISELYHLNARYVRCSKDNDLFYYNEYFGKRYARTSRTVVYPRFMQDASIPSSVVMLKSERDKTYGLPIYVASLTECEIERQLSEFNIAQINNGFNGSYVMNFNNGIPDDEQKEEIEREVNEKFCGSANAGRILLNFSNGKDNSVTLEKLDIENFAEKYDTTANRAQDKIYMAFRAPRVLFGDTKDANAFNDQDFKESFKIFNRTAILPLQRKIKGMFDKVFNMDDSVNITQYSIDWGEEETAETV